MPEYYGNGGIIGANNQPNAVTASGVWRSPQIVAALQNDQWPKYYNPTIPTIIDEMIANWSANSYAYRNRLWSKSSVAAGRENSTSAAVTSTLAATYYTSTSVSGTLGFTAQDNYDDGLQEGRQTNWCTIFARNTGQSAGQIVCEVNGSAVASSNALSSTVMTAGSTGSPMVTRYEVYQTNNGLDSISSIYTQNTKINDNSDNAQDFFVLPGRWSIGQVQTQDWNVSAATTLTTTCAVDDIVIAFMADSSATATWGTQGGTGTFSLLFDRKTAQNGCASQYKVYACTGAGTFTHTTGLDSFSVDTSYYRPKQLIRLEAVSI